MLLAEYAITKNPKGVTGLVLVGVLPAEDEYDRTSVTLYKLFERKSLLITFWKDGFEFDTITLSDLPDSVVECLGEGIIIQDVEQEIEFTCSVIEYISVPGEQDAAAAVAHF